MSGKTHTLEALRSALLKKGFEEINSKRHIKYVFYHEGKPTRIFTLVSYGGQRDIGRELFSRIKKQLKLDSPEQLGDFIDCPFTQEDLTRLLLKKGLIP